MPIYELICRFCDNKVEVIVKSTEIPKQCPRCNHPEGLFLQPSRNSFTFKDSPNSNTEVTSYDGRPTGYGDW